jgi:dynein light chain 1
LINKANITTLEDVLFAGNPVEEKASGEGVWVSEITKRLPYAKKLDGKTLIRDIVEEEKQE